MNKLILILIIIAIQSCATSTKSVNQTITGNIQNNSNYLGGANPPQEIVDNLAVYRPSENQTFYVRSGDTNTPYTTVLTSFTTNASGNYSLDLQPGIYSIISQQRFNFEQVIPASQTCNWLLEPDFVLIVTAAQNSYSNQYTITRNYCMPLPG